MALRSRATWLIGLLAVQSASSFILAGNEALIQRHPAIVYFLTMLVGAGGNAGNQSAVRVIRGLATGGSCLPPTPLPLVARWSFQFISYFKEPKEINVIFFLNLALARPPPSPGTTAADHHLPGTGVQAR